MYNQIPHTCTINSHIHVQSSHIHVQSNPTYMYNHIPHTCTIKYHIHVLKSKGKELHTQTDKRSRNTRTVAQTGGHSAIYIESSSNIYFYLFSILNYKKTEQNRKHNGQLLFR